MTKTRDTLGAVLWQFTLVAVPAIVVLGVLNGLPQFLGGEPLTVVRYDTVEQLQDRRRLAVWRPSALPAPWAWPPTRVRLATGDPDWVELLFEPTGDRDDALVIGQTANTGPVGATALLRRPTPARAALLTTDVHMPEPLLPRGQLLQESDVAIGNRPAHMRRLLLEEGVIVHELWWQQGTTTVILRLRGPVDRLTRVADTILRRRP
jgi:hypothetical protein